MKVLLAVLFLVVPVQAAEVWKFEVTGGTFIEETRITVEKANWRIDRAFDSILYFEENQQYFGLEHRNALFWKFRWSQVEAAIHRSQKQAVRFSDWTTEGYVSDPVKKPAPEGPVWNWKAGTESKKIRNWEAYRREGVGNGVGPVTTWASADPAVIDFLRRFQPIHHQITQAVVRPCWSAWIDEATESLRAYQQAPVEIEWGGGKEKSRWKLISHESKEVSAEIFQVPQKYRKTTIEALRGIVDQEGDEPVGK